MLLTPYCSSKANASSGSINIIMASVAPKRLKYSVRVLLAQAIEFGKLNGPTESKNFGWHAHGVGVSIAAKLELHAN